jgi:hypothetical protein
MAQAESSDQSALGPDGQLLDASRITWYNDPDDPNPIQSTSTSSRVQEGKVLNFVTFSRRPIFLSGQVGQRSRPIRSTAGTRLAEAIAAEKLDEYGSSCRRFIVPHDVKASVKRKQPTTNGSHGVGGGNAIQVETDTEDKTFAISVSEGGCDDDSLDSDSDGIEIRNKKVWIALSLFWYKLI